MKLRTPTPAQRQALAERRCRAGAAAHAGTWDDPGSAQRYAITTRCIAPGKRSWAQGLDRAWVEHAPTLADPSLVFIDAVPHIWPHEEASYAIRPIPGTRASFGPRSRTGSRRENRSAGPAPDADLVYVPRRGAQ